jgi:hypothetical protein
MVTIFICLACTPQEEGPGTDELAVTDSDTPAGDDPATDDPATDDPQADDPQGDDPVEPDDDTVVDPCPDPNGDEDGDGVPNGIEGSGDKDFDGAPNCMDPDADGDGFLDSKECPSQPCLNSDTDETPDFMDKDSDNDGLSDKEEVEAGTDPTKKDTDGDNSDDLAEIVYGSDPLDDTDSIPDGLFFVVLPYNAPEDVTRTLTFSTLIEAIDVQIVIDISGSMNDEIAQVQTGIKDNIIDPIVTEFPQAEFASFGISRISWNGTSKFLRQKQTFSVDEVKTAVDAVNDDAFSPAVGGNELHSEVLYQLAAGEEFHGTAKFCPKGLGCGFLADAVVNLLPADCTGEIGTIGHACFRKKAMPIYIMITDEEREDCDPNGTQVNSECYWVAGQGFMNGHTFAEAIAVMGGIGAKFIGINTWHDKTADGEANVGIDPQTDMQMLAEQTGSLNGNGEPFIYHTATPTGEGMPEQIAQAIKDLITFIDMDVTTGKMSDQECDGISAAEFVKSSTTVAADPTDGVSGQDATTFFSVKQGTTVTFDVRFFNDFCKNTLPEPVVYDALVTVLGNGSYLSNRLVKVIVPAADAQ